MKHYQNYHKHSHVSNIILADAVVTNRDYAQRAKELGHTLLSSCEHGTQGDYWECHALAEEFGLKWRYVSEAYFVKDRREKDRTNCHIILAAKTAKGIGDLNEALSEANVSGYYYHPRVDMELLMGLSPADVFITTACIAGVFKYGPEDAEKLIAELSGHFRGSFMLEAQYHHTPRQRELNSFLLDMYRKYRVPLIMGVDSHYIYPEQDELREQRLEANHIHYENEEGWFLDYPSDEEAFRRFREQGVLSDAQIAEAMENTNIFLDFEDVSLDKSRKIPTLYPHLSQEERNRLYLDTVYAEWEKYSKGMPDAEKQRYLREIEYETSIVTGTNISDYFLLDYEIVREAKKRGGIITPTGRGSAVSFFTNSLLGLSSVDRMKIPVEMFPDRFISADRILAGNLPDIDLNIGSLEIFQAVQEEKLGAWHSAPMVAFGKLQRSAAWKMYCRAAKVDFETANRISDKLKAYDTALKHADDNERDELSVSDFIPEKYLEQVEMSAQYTGIINSIAPHPCAHLLCRNDIRREIGIYRLNPKGGSKKGPVYAAFIEGTTAEKYGYLKNDLLSVDVVKVNRAAFDRIKKPLPSASELVEKTRNDNETWRMYAEGLTIGLNQCERDRTRVKAMQYMPRNITELSAFVAAVRPAFQSMLGTFLARQPFDYGIPTFDKLIRTKEMRSSFLLYQEQLMKTLVYAGLTPPESYSAIKAIAKKHPEKILPYKEKFLVNFTERVLEDESCEIAQAEEAAEKVWTIIEDATAYLFNASHAVCVALDSLYSAWLKAHHPLDFYATILQIYGEKGDKERLARIKTEMLRGFGIRVVPCKFRQDNRDYYIDQEKNTISDALTSVKFMSKKVASELYRMRGNQYGSFVDLLLELENNGAFNSRQVDILIQMGYFGEFGSAGKLLKVSDEFRNGETRYSKGHVEKTREARLACLREFERGCDEPEIPYREQLLFEVAYLGNPVSLYPEHKGEYLVLGVDEKYSPKITLYNLFTGTSGVMKSKKKEFESDPLCPGDFITIPEWQQKPIYSFEGGTPRRRGDLTEPWILKYEKISQNHVPLGS